MKPFLKQQEGAVIVLVALMMSIFVGFLALVMDMGSIYLEKNRLQKIADAAALAGAQELPNYYSQAEQEVQNAIHLNGGDLTNFTMTTNQSYTMLEVIVSKKATFYFAKALGINEPIVQANARVELQPLSAGKGAIPLGVQPSSDLSFGSLQTLKVSDSATGNFGAIALTGPGAKDYETDLKYGYEFDLKVGTILNTQTGQLAGPTKRAIEHRISLCPNSTYLNYTNDCSRIVLVPIFESIQIDQNQIKQVKVVGFATFFLESVSSTSTGAVVTGRFINETHAGQSSSTQANFGTYSFKLTQ
ncbi:pilus assembly protein TadG-related protein [Bacillus sp. Marseille-P3661]|uniref:pilus assembly protein TadG-related protein n=1 Tax=Bacillus sp. Marseille-P3661 TaxID=1936234 RepID=UPI0015E1649E|nr:pilus assembly protein TadG-related protein [Bacillus sp. Marseille-P3661]